MSHEFDDILTKGLLEGYAGNAVRAKVHRGAFRLTSSHYQDSPHSYYHDEWIAGDLTGGGQEIAKLEDGKKVTRLYGGGIIDEDALARIGLKPDDVVGKRGILMSFLNRLGNRTRLSTPVKDVDGPWRYEYKIINGRVEIKTLVTREEISHDGHFVFAHFFIITEIT